MLGAVIGDIYGTWHQQKTGSAKPGNLMFSDDTVMTAAIAEALLCARRSGEDPAKAAVRCMRHLGSKYPDCGFGELFAAWLKSPSPAPYGSFGNGAAMRVSPCGYFCGTLEETLKLARAVTEVTHSHPEGIRGAEAVAGAVFLARAGADKEILKAWFTEEKGYELPDPEKDPDAGVYAGTSCQATVPIAAAAVLTSSSFEETVQRAASFGGDTDTIAAMAGSIAEALWGIPEFRRRQAIVLLTDDIRKIILDFETEIESEPFDRSITCAEPSRCG